MAEQPMNTDPDPSMRRAEKLKNFDPDNNGLKDKGLFGLPFDTGESSIVIIPVPWDATVSFGEGTMMGPETVLEASHQIDLYDENAPYAWHKGFAMEEVSENWKDLNREYRAKAKYNIDHLERKFEAPETVRDEVYNELEEVCEMLNQWVYESAKAYIDNGQLVGLVGGEHSVPLGLMKALGDTHENFGVLQIDAHADLREAYQGFKYSHASIMYNALNIPAIEPLVQVGVRDFAHKEANLVKNNSERIHFYSDLHLKNRRFQGESWHVLCDEIVKELPDKVYVSFDIDGLAPVYCPDTGTPVPGGLAFEEAAFLINALSRHHKQIIGFDLCEVAPNPTNDNQLDSDWNGNVGARMLYRLCCESINSLQ